MSKKHFIRLAQMMAAYRSVIPEPVFSQMVDELSSICASCNKQFSRSRFRAACYE